MMNGAARRNTELRDDPGLGISLASPAMRATGDQHWNPVIERMPEEELLELKLTRLQRQLKWCYEQSYYYRNALTAVGCEPGDIRSLDDLRALPPLIDKEHHRDAQQESLERARHPYGSLLCAHLREVVHVHTTSGTTGDPTFYCYTPRDWALNIELACRNFWAVGVRPGDTVMWGFGLGMWVAATYIPALQHLGARVIQVGAEAGSRQILRLAELCKPRVLVGTPSFLGNLHEKAQDLGSSVESLGLEMLVAGGEPGAGLPDVRSQIREAYGDARLFDIYGPAYQFAFISCDGEAYHGLHDHARDLCFYLDDLRDVNTGEPVTPVDGAVGEAILTELLSEAAPAVKYSIKDIFQIDRTPCVCGLPGPRVRLLGRSDDMLIVRGVNVYPAAIRNVIASFRPGVTGQARVVLNRPPPLADAPLHVEVESEIEPGTEAAERLQREIAEKVRDLLRVNTAPQVVPTGTLGRATRKSPLVEVRP